MTDMLEEWKIKKRARQIWVDPDFKKFIEKEYPNARNPERTRRIMDWLLYGKEKK